MSQRREFLAGNLFNNQPATIALTAQAGDRHPAHRKRDLHGISEAKRLQFRLEMFNTFNHPNFFAPDLNLGDYHLDSNGVNIGTFGKISQAYPSRDIQAALKFYW